MFDTRRSAMERNLSALLLVAMVFSSLMGEVMGMMPRLPLPQRQAAHHEPSQSPQHPPPERVPFAVAKLRFDLLAKRQA
jgi:hypothetical protein